MYSDHRHTHELKLHQLLVRVVGWEQVKPVSVDKVGVFFRYAAPDQNNPSNTVSFNGLLCGELIFFYINLIH